MIKRQNVKDVKTLALSLAHELNSLALDLCEKTAFEDTIGIISVVDSALDCLKGDMSEWYGKHLKQVEDNFYKHEPVA